MNPQSSYRRKRLPKSAIAGYHDGLLGPFSSSREDQPGVQEAHHLARSDLRERVREDANTRSVAVFFSFFFLALVSLLSLGPLGPILAFAPSSVPLPHSSKTIPPSLPHSHFSHLTSWYSSPSKQSTHHDTYFSSGRSQSHLFCPIGYNKQYTRALVIYSHIKADPTANNS